MAEVVAPEPAGGGGQAHKPLLTDGQLATQQAVGQRFQDLAMRVFPGVRDPLPRGQSHPFQHLGRGLCPGGGREGQQSPAGRIVLDRKPAQGLRTARTQNGLPQKGIDQAGPGLRHRSSSERR